MMFMIYYVICIAVNITIFPYIFNNIGHSFDKGIIMVFTSILSFVLAPVFLIHLMLKGMIKGVYKVIASRENRKLKIQQDKIDRLAGRSGRYENIK